MRVRKKFVYDEIEKGKLKALRLSPRRLRITEKALEDFIFFEQESCEQMTKVCASAPRKR